MMRKENTNRRRKLFNIRFGLSTINAEDEFAGCAAESSRVRPDFLRWFCGMHDLEETYVCQVL